MYEVKFLKPLSIKYFSSYLMSVFLRNNYVYLSIKPSKSADFSPRFKDPSGLTSALEY